MHRAAGVFLNQPTRALVVTAPRVGLAVVTCLRCGRSSEAVEWVVGKGQGDC